MKTTSHAITTPSGAPRATHLADLANARTPASRTSPLERGRRLVQGPDGRMVEISIKKPATGGLGTSGFVIGTCRCGLQRL